MKRFWLNIILLVLTLFCMSFHVFNLRLHEVFGTLLLVGALWHIWQNRRFFGGIVKGKWNLQRINLSLTGALMLASFLVANVTGILISQFVFADVVSPLEMQFNMTIHELHHLAAYLMLIFTGVHLGIHWGSMWQRLKKAVPLFAVFDNYPRLVFWFVVVVGWVGVFASRINHVGDRLLMRHVFGTIAMDLPGVVNILLVLSIVGMYAGLAYFAQNYLFKRKQKISVENKIAEHSAPEM